MTRTNQKVTEGAAEIVRRLRETDVTVGGLMREHRCAYSTLVRAILSQITQREYHVIARKRLGRGGVSTQFKPGLVPWNKGRKGWCAKGTEATQFKPGQIRGAAARKYRTIGSITIRRDTDAPKHANYGRPRVRFSRWIKVKDDGRPQDRYIPYARWLWERENGPVPLGCFVGHKDNNTMNDVPDNLILVTSRHQHISRLKDRPDIEAKRRSRTSIATKRRHAQNREVKKWARTQKQQSRIIWECAGCGAEVPAGAEQCRKCGSWSIVKSRVEPMPDSMLIGETR